MLNFIKTFVVVSNCAVSHHNVKPRGEELIRKSQEIQQCDYFKVAKERIYKCQKGGEAIAYDIECYKLESK